MSDYLALAPEGEIMSTALALIENTPPPAFFPPPQATGDGEMIALWLASFRSPHTRRAYAADARAFMDFTQLPLVLVTVRDVQAFAASLTGTVATIARRLTGMKSLLSLAHRLGYLQVDVGVPVQLPAIKDMLAERILTEWQVQRMLEAEPDQRNAALLRLTYGAGLRISEVCGLCWRDLVPRGAGGGQVTVFGKGGKTRVVLLPAGLWARVNAIRGAMQGDAAVFRSRNGACLDPSQVHRIVKQAAKRAGLPASVSAHWLRHAHVSHALDRGAPMHVVRATVGHASLETTTRYAHARPDDSSARYLTS
jgi:site-specific recombinase XerD